MICQLFGHAWEPTDELSNMPEYRAVVDRTWHMVRCSRCRRYTYWPLPRGTREG